MELFRQDLRFQKLLKVDWVIWFWQGFPDPNQRWVLRWPRWHPPLTVAQPTTHPCKSAVSSLRLPDSRVPALLSSSWLESYWFTALPSIGVTDVGSKKGIRTYAKSLLNWNGTNRRLLSRRVLWELYFILGLPFIVTLKIQLKVFFRIDWFLRILARQFAFNAVNESIGVQQGVFSVLLIVQELKLGLRFVRLNYFFLHQVYNRLKVLLLFLGNLELVSRVELFLLLHQRFFSSLNHLKLWDKRALGRSRFFLVGFLRIGPVMALFDVFSIDLGLDLSWFTLKSHLWTLMERL